MGIFRRLKTGTVRPWLIFFFLAAGLFSTRTARSQTVTSDGTSMSLPKLFKQIRKETGYVVAYNEADIKGVPEIRLPKGKLSLADALEKALKANGLTFTISSKTIFVNKAKTSTAGQPDTQLITADFNLIDIKGRVIDEMGTAVVGVTVSIKNTTRGMATDGMGQFYFEKVPISALVVVQGIGYTKREFSAAPSMLVQLNQEVSGLDEVQVIAYGTTTKRISTGSISSISAKDLASQPISNPLAALQGRIPGLIVSQTSGIPGSSFKVQLRGQSALDLSLSKNDPLFVIDGVPFEQGNMNTNQLSNAAGQNGGGLSALNLINLSDVERIDVLKDADATSIYGSRGANGVIIITTKKGTRRTTEATVNIYTGFSWVGQSQQMLNTQQYIAMRREAFKNDSINMTPEKAPDILLWDTSRFTNFKDLLIGRRASVNSVNVGVTGGTERTRFRTSAGYRKESSVFVSSLSDQVASFSLNVNHRTADDRLALDLSAIYGIDRNRLPRKDMSQYLATPPNLKLFTEDGTLSWEEAGVAFSSVGLENPLARLKATAESENENFSGNLNLSYHLIQNLLLKINAGYNRFHTNERALNPYASIDPFSSTLPSAEFANNSNSSWIIEPQLSWDQAKGDSKWSVLFGSTLQQRKSEGINVTGSNYKSDLLLTSISGAGVIRSTNNYSRYRYGAAFGRFNYSYKGKYIANLTGRRDGSSRFGPKNQWANFGAIGGAWLFGKELFLKQLDPVLSFGKLRFSYGTTGNDQIGDYKFLNLWQNTPTTYDGHDGLYPTSLFNPEYSWEINKKIELGIDLGFFMDKVAITVNYYRNRCENQLINYTLGGQTGFFGVVRNFPGLVQNTGIEAIVTSNLKFGNLNWSASANLSFPKSKLIAFPGIENSSYKDVYIVGKPLSVLQGIRYTGVDPQSGLYSFADKNGDGQVYDLPDYFVLGDTDPDLYGGIQNTFTYKSWDLSFFIHFTKQRGANYIQQFWSPPGNLKNQPTLVLERWTAPGDNASVQRFTSSTATQAGIAAGLLASSDAAYTDASFARLKNASLAYTFSLKRINKGRVKSCRIFVEGQNIAILTGYKGPDPEVQNFYTLPPLATVAGGIQLNL